MAVSLPPALAKARRPGTERTRRRLLDAGLALLASQGPEGVTSHAIAAEAGYAAGTFYLHFRHKQALFQELADRAAGELEERLTALAAVDCDPRRLAQAQAEALVGFAEDHRDLFRVVFRPGSGAGETGPRTLERLARGVRRRRQVAMAEGRAAECLDADVLAQAIVGMWVRVLVWWVEDPTRARREDIVRTLAHFQLHGSRTSEPAPCSLGLEGGRRRSPARAGRVEARSKVRPRRPRGARSA